MNGCVGNQRGSSLSGFNQLFSEHPVSLNSFTNLFVDEVWGLMDPRLALIFL